MSAPTMQHVFGSINAAIVQRLGETIRWAKMAMSPHGLLKYQRSLRTLSNTKPKALRLVS